MFDREREKTIWIYRKNGKNLFTIR